MKAAEAEEVKLYSQMPPIEKMDASLSTLAACKWVFMKKFFQKFLWYWKINADIQKSFKDYQGILKQAYYRCEVLVYA